MTILGSHNIELGNIEVLFTMVINEKTKYNEIA